MLANFSYVAGLRNVMTDSNAQRTERPLSSYMSYYCMYSAAGLQVQLISPNSPTNYYIITATLSLSLANQASFTEGVNTVQWVGPISAKHQFLCPAVISVKQPITKLCT